MLTDTTETQRGQGLLSISKGSMKRTGGDIQFSSSAIQGRRPPAFFSLLWVGPYRLDRQTTSPSSLRIDKLGSGFYDPPSFIGTGPDMHHRMGLVIEPISGTICCNRLLPSPF